MPLDVNYTSWSGSIGDETLQDMIDNASLPSNTLPPAETLWKTVAGYKKAQDALNATQGTSPERLNTVSFLQMGPAVETNADGTPFVRGRATVECIIFLGPDNVQGNTILI